jgi:hypothetical protein
MNAVRATKPRDVRDHPAVVARGLPVVTAGMRAQGEMSAVKTFSDRRSHRGSDPPILGRPVARGDSSVSNLLMLRRLPMMLPASGCNRPGWRRSAGPWLADPGAPDRSRSLLPVGSSRFSRKIISCCDQSGTPSRPTRNSDARCRASHRSPRLVPDRNSGASQIPSPRRG